MSQELAKFAFFQEAVEDARGKVRANGQGIWLKLQNVFVSNGKIYFYEPMDKVDAEKIMEEILGMKAGLNPDQQVSQTIIRPQCFHKMMLYAAI